MELHEIVLKLVGPVRATGEHNTDQQRLDNMKILTELVNHLLFEITKEEPNADRQEASMKAIGTHARRFLEDVRLP